MPQFNSGFSAGFDAGFEGQGLAVGIGVPRRKLPPPISPEIREREWQEQLAAAAARMQVNYQQAGEAQWKARTRSVPKMSPDYERVANKNTTPDYEAVIFRLPEDKRKKK